ncbi:hypothetical protein PR048_019899 [Dryococelus australis]|uniref:Reverse transcriptase n=1 Tax=Dryococelus australis TaxID=614101 RepID=A0ABQ9H4Z8_9NEOP|nr:hypothetical protein PR048_019899 [Dryococelus australis]
MWVVEFSVPPFWNLSKIQCLFALFVLVVGNMVPLGGTDNVTSLTFVVRMLFTNINACTTLTTALDYISFWLDDHGFNLYVDKSHNLNVTRKQSLSPLPSPTIRCSLLSCVQKVLAHYHWGSSFFALRSFYVSINRSVLDYGIPITGQLPLFLMNKLETLQNVYLRLMICAFTSTPITVLHIESFLMSLSNH